MKNIYKLRFLLVSILVVAISLVGPGALLGASGHDHKHSAVAVSGPGKTANGAFDRGNDKLKVAFLDIGQGDCEIIRTPSGKIIMIDAGDDRENAADGVILPYLAANGIKKIDILIMSHAHRDHIGGMIGLIPKIDIGAVYENHPASTAMYSEILKALKAKGVPVHKVWKDDKIELGDGIDATVLHPPKNWKTKPGFEDKADPMSDTAADNNLNDFSVVLRMQYGNMVYQFGGDAEAGAEDEIIANVPENIIKTYVYKVCHHGSDTSSTPAYLAKLRPEVSVISCGVNNQFKHPRPSTLKNLEYYSRVIYRTDIDKTVESWSNGQVISFSTAGMPNVVSAPAKVTDITPYSATIEWETSQLSTSVVKYCPLGAQTSLEKSVEGYSTSHKVTITGLIPGKTYEFRIESESKREKSDVLSDTGKFTTAADPGVTAPKTTLTTAPEKVFVFEKAVVTVKIENAPADSQVILYEDAISDANRLAASTGVLEGGQASFDWTPKFGKVYELFAVIKSKNAVIAVVSFSVNAGRRLVIFDEGHQNLGCGYFEDMKVDLFNRGLAVASNYGRITPATLETASVLVISEYATTEAGLDKDEIEAIKGFVNSGGGLLLVGRCDYKGLSNNATINRVLEQTGSNLRINDDEAVDPTNCVGGMKWVLLPELFERKIVPAEVNKALFSGSATVLNSRMKPVTDADKSIIRLACGDADSSNIDADGQGDAVIYPKGTTVVYEAAEIMPSGGKIALFTSQHVLQSVYTFTSQHQTPVYNFGVVNWLAHPAKKGVEELSDEITSLPVSVLGSTLEKAHASAARLAGETAVIGASIRAVEAFDKLEKEFDPQSPKFEEAIDRLLARLKKGDAGAKNETAALVKKVLDRVRYSAASDPDMFDRIGKKIEALEEHYQRLIK